MQKKRMSFVILMILAITIISMSVLTVRMHVKEDIDDKYFSIPVAATEHAKIRIYGNAELDAFCSEKGTDGLSWATAHVIENYEIDAGDSGSGIWLVNTDRFLIIRNIVAINSGYSTYEGGITLITVKNVKIIKCDVNNNADGLVLYESVNINISDNIAMYNDQRGIWLVDISNNNIISGNNASHNGRHGILLRLSEYNTISGNNASYNGGYGVSLNFMSHNNEIYENVFCDNIEGAYEDKGKNNDIRDNYGCPGNPDGEGTFLIIIISTVLGVIATVIIVSTIIIIRRRRKLE